MHSLV